MEKAEYGPLKPPQECPLPDNATAYKDNPIMAIAWHDAVLFAAGEEAVIKRFEEETGLIWPYRSNLSGEESNVVKPEGYDVAVLRRFISWFNIAVWGEDPFV